MLAGEQVPTVDRYKYLGMWLTEDFAKIETERNDLKSHIKDRRSKANALLNKTRPFLRTRTIPIHLRLRVLKSQLYPILTYGAEWMGMHAQGILQGLRSPLSKALKWIIGYKASNKVCQAAVLCRELNIPFPEAVLARARTRAFFKWKHSKTQISDLLNNPHKSRTKSWVTHTPYYLKTFVKITENDISEGKLNPKKAEEIAKKAFNYVTKAILAAEAKTELSGSMKQYEDCDFEATRNYIRHATWLPGLSVGVSWLVRFRTNSTWTKKRLRGYLNRKDNDSSIPVESSYQCASCKEDIRHTDEKWHVLVTCKKYKTQREKILGMFMPAARQAAIELMKIEEPIYSQMEANMGILFIGGFSGVSEWHFTKAFGHNPKVVLNNQSYTHGFVPVAMFLARVMTSHIDNVFRSYDQYLNKNHRNGGYITESQSDF
jgi:hypothetical protein